jgi:hypothetical protein
MYLDGIVEAGAQFLAHGLSQLVALYTKKEGRGKIRCGWGERVLHKRRGERGYSSDKGERRGYYSCGRLGDVGLQRFARLINLLHTLAKKGEEIECERRQQVQRNRERKGKAMHLVQGST